MPDWERELLEQSAKPEPAAAEAPADEPKAEVDAAPAEAPAEAATEQPKAETAAEAAEAPAEVAAEPKADADDKTTN